MIATMTSMHTKRSLSLIKMENRLYKVRSTEEIPLRFKPLFVKRSLDDYHFEERRYFLNGDRSMSSFQETDNVKTRSAKILWCGQQWERRR